MVKNLTKVINLKFYVLKGILVGYTVAMVTNILCYEDDHNLFTNDWVFCDTIIVIFNNYSMSLRWI